MTEVVALVDADGTVTGSVDRAVCRRENLLHAATAVLVRHPDARIYLHRRTATKDWAPGHWDVAAGGMLRPDESPSGSAARELAEELGITGAPLRPLGSHRYEDDTTRCFEHVYGVVWDGPVRHQAEEVAEGRWTTLDDLARLLHDRALPFVPDTRGLLAHLAAEGVGDYAQLRAFAAVLDAGLPLHVTRHGPVRSLAEAAVARGIAPHQLVKTMVIRLSDAGHRLVLLPGDREISWPLLRGLLGVNRLSLPSAEAARAVTGYERGTITPFGTLTPLPVVLDAAVTGEISLGGGAQGVALTVEADAVRRAFDALTAPVSEPA